MSVKRIRFPPSPVTSSKPSSHRPPDRSNHPPCESAHACRQTPAVASHTEILVPSNASPGASNRSTTTRPPHSVVTRFVPRPPTHSASHVPTQVHVAAAVHMLLQTCLSRQVEDAIRGG